MTGNTIGRSRAPLLAALLLAACAGSPDAPTEEPDLAQSTLEGSKAVGRAVTTGAKAFGRGMGTAYEGVTNGFQEPSDRAAYGPPPKHAVSLVKKHFARVLRYPDSTRFKIGRPERGYMNKGILRGGGVAWQGWLVDVDVETVQGLTKHRAAKSYVVRIRDGDIIEVHKDDSLLRRLDTRPDARPARMSPR